MFDVYVFIDGVTDNPEKNVGVREFTVNDNFGVAYPSNEYADAFHPSSPIALVILEESSIVIIFELLSAFGINVNVPFPLLPVKPSRPATP